jgi:hypothetical protein
MSHFEKRTVLLRNSIILLLFVFNATGCDVRIRPPAAACTVCAAIRWQDPDQAIDVVFVPDDDYGDLSVVANLQVFLDDVSNMIDEGFWQNNAMAHNLGAFNFWFMTQTGDVQPPDEGICPNVTWPDLTDAAFAEVLVLLHPNPLRDCAFGNRVTSEPGSYRTVVHETSHGAFVLPDEYCCDGGYWEAPPVLYETEEDCNNDPENEEWRDCQCFTDMQGEDWCRSEDTTGDIMSIGGITVWEYGPVDWVIVRGVLNGLGLGVPNDPTVFAPDNWDWP